MIKRLNETHFKPFPHVTVCPPQKSFLNLNYDVMKADEIEIDEQKRIELLDFALEVVQESFYFELMANLSKVEDPDRNKNFYHGYTMIKYPYINKYRKHGLDYDIHTSASTGKLSTKDFAKAFNVDKIDGDIEIFIKVYTPDLDAKITFNLEKITMKQFRNYDVLGFLCYPFEPTCPYDADLTNISETRDPADNCNNFNYYDYDIDYSRDSSCDYSYEIYLVRQISQEEIKNMRILDKMPGFMITWNSSEINNVPKFIDDSRTKQFVRYFLNLSFCVTFVST